MCSFYESWIGNCIHSIEWWHCWWPWVTPNTQTTIFSTCCNGVHVFITGEDSNLVCKLIHRKSHPSDEKSSLKGVWSRLCEEWGCEDSGCFPPKVSETAAWNPMVRTSLKWWSTTMDWSDFTVPSPIPLTHLGICAYGLTWRRHTGEYDCSAPRQLITQPTSWPHIASPTWSSMEQVARSTTKQFRTSDWRPGGVLSTVDMVVQWCDGPRQLCDDDDDYGSVFRVMWPLKILGNTPGKC